MVTYADCFALLSCSRENYWLDDRQHHLWSNQQYVTDLWCPASLCKFSKVWGQEDSRQFFSSELRESMLHMSGGKVPELVSKKAESSVSHCTEAGKGHSTLRGSEGVGWGDNMVIWQIRKSKVMDGLVYTVRFWIIFWIWQGVNGVVEGGWFGGLEQFWKCYKWWNSGPAESWVGCHPQSNQKNFVEFTVNIPIEKGAAPGHSHEAHQKCGLRNDNDTTLRAWVLPKEKIFLGRM